MPAEADAETADNPIPDQQRRKVLPAKCENYGYRRQMEKQQHYGVSPIDRSAKMGERGRVLH